MVAQCSTCFFGRTVPADGSVEAPVAPGALCCQRYAPQAQPIQTGARPLWLWPVVLPDYWCGDYAAADPNVYGPFGGLPNTTGAGTPTLGTNCPAVDPTTPYTWLTTIANDGSTIYIPAWK